MTNAMWTYPWDVQDVGLDRVIEELRGDAGLDTISLTSSYHAGRFLQPRSPGRPTYFPEDGTIYFEPTAARWAEARVVPQVARCIREGGDVLAEAIRRRDAGGLAVSSWTVCLHNMRLGLAYPDIVTRDAFDQPQPFSLCPSHPQARRYVATLVEDLSHSYRPNRVELETPTFMGWAHGYHHEKDGVGVTPEDDLLLSLCFCPACLDRAGRAGVDGRAAQATVRRLAAEGLAREVPAPRWPDLAARGPGAFAAYPELHAYLLWRFEPVTSLIAEIRDRTHPDTEVVVIDLAEGWLGGCDHAAVARACDGLLICAYDMDARAVEDRLVGIRRTIGDGKRLYAGFRLFYPEMQSAADVAERVAGTRAARVDGVNFYNYGLVPRARLAWAAHALAR